MRKTVLACVALVAIPLSVHAAAFTAGDLVVLRVGNGVAPLANTGGILTLLEFDPAGSVIQTISIPAGDGGLQVSGTATSEGQIVRSVGDASFTVTGYVPPYAGTGSLPGRNATDAPRGYATVDAFGNVSSTTVLAGNYSGQNIRSGMTTPGGSYFTGSGTGAGSGLVYYNGSSATTIQGVNSRVVSYYNGNLFYSTGSGTVGLYSYSGLPTAATASTPFLTGVAGQGASPYDFAFSPDGNSLYVADDAIGVQKFTYNGSAWGLAYNFTGQTAGSGRAFGLEVDFSGLSPVLYWTTPTNVWMAVDEGIAASGTNILSAGANFAFRGLVFAPSAVPEPSIVILVLGGLISLVAIRRLQQRN